MKANVIVKRSIPILQIPVLEMDVLLSKPKTNIYGVPVYFDERRRVWPKPFEGIDVKFEDDVGVGIKSITINYDGFASTAVVER